MNTTLTFFYYQDPMAPIYISYTKNCQVPKEGHLGQFPANFCVKMIGTSGKLSLGMGDWDTEPWQYDNMTTWQHDNMTTWQHDNMTWQYYIQRRPGRRSSRGRASSRIWTVSADTSNSRSYHFLHISNIISLLFLEWHHEGLYPDLWPRRLQSCLKVKTQFFERWPKLVKASKRII